MKRYQVAFKLNSASEVMIFVLKANSKEDAYDKTVYQKVPEAFDGTLPYSAWVLTVEYSNGRVHTFNTSEGNPY